jgi:hypothetical protein
MLRKNVILSIAAIGIFIAAIAGCGEKKENTEAEKARKLCLSERIRQNELCLEKHGPITDDDIDNKSEKFMKYHKCEVESAEWYKECIRKPSTTPE